MDKPLYTKTNEETQMQSRVFAASQGGFTITLFDIDSGNTVPTMRRVTSLEDAKAIADAWVSDDVDGATLRC
jgi:hypothetical protein